MIQDVFKGCGYLLWTLLGGGLATLELFANQLYSEFQSTSKAVLALYNAFMVLKILALALFPRSVYQLARYVREGNKVQMDSPPKMFLLVFMSTLFQISLTAVHISQKEFTIKKTSELLSFLLLFLYETGFGFLVGGLQQRLVSSCRDMVDSPSGAKLNKATHILKQFQGFKKGCEFGLLSIFLYCAPTAILTTYMLIGSIAFPCLKDFSNIGMLIYVAALLVKNLMLLFYYSWTVEHCYQEFKGIIAPLR